MADCYFHPCIPTAELPDNSQGVSVLGGGGVVLLWGRLWGSSLVLGEASPDSG